MLRQSCNLKIKLDHRGFTLVELVIIIMVLGILAAVAIPRFSNMAESSKVTATQKELQNIKRALVGNPDIISGGVYVNRGFEGDCGFLPSLLSDLTNRPGSLLVYDKLTRLGWNGPYLENNSGEYAFDAWGISYIYDSGNRRIMSVGGVDSIIVNF